MEARYQPGLDCQEAEVNELKLLDCGFRRMAMFAPNCRVCLPLDPGDVIDKIVHGNLKFELLV
jgi:hypothetical protein